MEDTKPVIAPAAPGRDEASASSNTDVEMKPSASTANTNESAEASSTTTMMAIPGVQQKKMKPFKLADAIKPIEYEEMRRMSTDSFCRILQSEGKISSSS